MSGIFLNETEYIFNQLARNLLGGDMCIDVPKDYHARVRMIKHDMMDEDRSGIVASVIEFMIATATVDFRISTTNPNLTKILDGWKKNINEELLEQVPSGVKALANQYFRERWTNSMVVLNISWKRDEKTDLILPDKMWFSDGCHVHVEGEGRILGKYTYWIGEPKTKGSSELPLPNTTMIVRKSNSSWYDKYPSPYLVKRGTMYHWKFKKMLVEKQFDVLKSILMYMLLAKKGDKDLILDGDTVTDEDLIALKEKLQQLKGQSNSRVGPNGLVGAFPVDTTFEHFMPDLTKLFNESIMAPTDRNILASLGLIEIVEGISTSRKDAILNPKPLVEEIKAGVKDFQDLMIDVLKLVRRKNIKGHPKLFTTTEIKVSPSTIKAFVDDNTRVMMRSWYDRGIVSKREALESTTDLDFEIQVEEKVVEENLGVNDLMTPPPIVYQPELQDEEDIENPENNTETPEQKTSQPDFKVEDTVIGDINCERCNTPINYADYPEASWGLVKCPNCKALIDQTGKQYEGNHHNKKRKKKPKKEVYIQAPFDNNEDLPKNVKVLPQGAQTIWRKTFNKVFEDNADLPKDQREGKAIRIAWSAVRKQYKKVGDEWKKKETE